MSKNLNISVLVAARNEYIDQLKCIIVPLLIQGFNSIYSDAINISENKKVIYKFQELLKQIPQWNQTILQEESKRVKKKCPYIMDIVTAIFVTNVKILASVRLKGNKDDIRVKIPTSDIFIHGIYIEAAQQIFYDPFLFHHKSKTIQENKHHVKQIIGYAVDETIRQMLPFDDILQKYLAGALNDNAEFGEDSSSEEEVSDPDEKSLDGNDIDEFEDSSEGESEIDPDENKIKSFNVDGANTTLLPESSQFNGSQFIPDGSDDESSDDESINSKDNAYQIPQTQQPFQQQPIQVPSFQQPQTQPPPQQTQPFQQPQQVQQAPQIQQPQQINGGGYSFFS